MYKLLKVGLAECYGIICKFAKEVQSNPTDQLQCSGGSVWLPGSEHNRDCAAFFVWSCFLMLVLALLTDAVLRMKLSKHSTIYPEGI